MEGCANVLAKLNSLKANLANSKQGYANTPSSGQNMNILITTALHLTYESTVDIVLEDFLLHLWFLFTYNQPECHIVLVQTGTVCLRAGPASQIKMKASMLERGRFKVCSLPSSDQPSDGHMRSQQEPLLANLHRVSQAEIDVLHWVPKSKRWQK